MNKQKALEFKQKSEYHLKWFRDNLHKSFEYEELGLVNYKSYVYVSVR